jgi:hypothetical protein
LLAVLAPRFPFLSGQDTPANSNKRKHPFREAIRIPNVPTLLLEQLRELTCNFSLSLKCGDLLLLSGGWYVTHTGLILLAKRCHCSGMQVQPVRHLSDQANRRYAFRATVYKSARCLGFVGYGDADPSNVSPLVHGAEMRVAETRAVNRALRKAYGIGICSVEEIGSFADLQQSSRESKKFPPQRPMATATTMGRRFATAFAN